MTDAVKTPATTQPATRPSPIHIRKLGHIVIQVRNLERSIRFYTEVLNLRVSDHATAGGVFLTVSNVTDAAQVTTPSFRPTGTRRRSPPRALFGCITLPCRLVRWMSCLKFAPISRSAASRSSGKGDAPWAVTRVSSSSIRTAITSRSFAIWTSSVRNPAPVPGTPRRASSTRSSWRGTIRSHRPGSALRR